MVDPLPHGRIARTDSPATVFARYRSVPGRESPSTYSDSIEVVSAAAAGSIVGEVKLEEMNDFAGISVTVSNDPSLAPIVTGSLGEIEMSLIPPGTYTIALSFPGYNDVVITNVVVVAGTKSDLGTIVMILTTAVPLLAPGIWLLLAVALAVSAGRALRTR